MGLAPGIVVFILIWWLVLFCVLPWGVRQPDEPNPGHAAGAPERPRMLLRFLVTTIFASAIWGIVYWIVDAGLIDFRATI